MFATPGGCTASTRRTRRVRAHRAGGQRRGSRIRPQRGAEDGAADGRAGSTAPCSRLLFRSGARVQRPGANGSTVQRSSRVVVSVYNSRPRRSRQSRVCRVENERRFRRDETRGETGQVFVRTSLRRSHVRSGGGKDWHTPRTVKEPKGCPKLQKHFSARLHMDFLIWYYFITFLEAGRPRRP